MSVATRGMPAKRLELPTDVAEIAHRSYPGIGLDPVGVDDHGDLAHPLVDRARQRLPDLALLQLTVPGHDEDALLMPGEARGTHHSLCLRDAHAEWTRVRDDPGRPDVGMAGQTTEPAQGVEPVEGQQPQSDKNPVESRNIVALGGEEDVARLRLWFADPA